MIFIFRWIFVIDFLFYSLKSLKQYICMNKLSASVEKKYRIT